VSLRNRRRVDRKEKLIKVGAKVISDGCYVAFRMAEVAIPRNLFADILQMIGELRPPPVTSTASCVRPSRVPSKLGGDVRLDDKKSLLLLATGNADTLPSPSAIRNDICLLQKAANGKKLGLTEASI